MRCHACPLPPGIDCSAAGTPVCGHVAAGRAEWITWVRGKTVPATAPLAGDIVAAMSRRIGGDRFARWVAKVIGADCECAGRQKKLNEIDAKLRRYLHLSS